MNTNIRKVICAALILLLFASVAVTAAACRKMNAEQTDKDTTVSEIVTIPDSDSKPVFVDPTTAASDGLVFESRGDGTCVIKGMGSCNDSCLIIPDMSAGGETVTGIAVGAFAGNTCINAVQIPAGINVIGDGAFAGCTSLAYISVSNSNSAYCDVGGLLYSQDMTELICIPAGFSNTAVTVEMKVKKIAPRASEGCGKLNKLLFEGSEEEWQKITVGGGNEILKTLNIIYMKQNGK